MSTLQEVIFEPDFRQWRAKARQLLLSHVSPDQILWSEASETQQHLWAEAAAVDGATRGALRVPGEFVKRAELVACHRGPERWELLYRLLYRLTHGEPNVLSIDCDEDVARFNEMHKAVARDMHKMRAFVRFRRTASLGREEYVAWYRPDHHIVEANAPFFVRRFGSMPFAILTPERCAYWDREVLRFGPGLSQTDAPQSDELEEFWLDYYASVFNPARVKVRAMTREMPVRHWPTLPETAIIPDLLAHANQRVEEMAKKHVESAASFVPATRDLHVLAEAARGCRGCDLYKYATQTVFGEGPAHARVIMVGEQPGDSEDLAGHPFIGPAGRLLDQAMDEAGVDRKEVYVTNAVKHFKFVERGKRRLHQKPAGLEISACRPWLEAEITALKPDVLVCLGGTAAQSVMGRAVKVLTERGKLLKHQWAQYALITIHPSAVLRAPDKDMQATQFRSLVDDLKIIPRALGSIGTATALH